MHPVLRKRILKAMRPGLKEMELCGDYRVFLFRKHLTHALGYVVCKGVGMATLTYDSASKSVRGARGQFRVSYCDPEEVSVMLKELFCV